MPRTNPKEMTARRCSALAIALLCALLIGVGFVNAIAFEQRDSSSQPAEKVLLKTEGHTDSPPGVAVFQKEIVPILQERCYGCHTGGSESGNVAFDTLDKPDEILAPELWFKVLKNLRAGIMPPKDEERLTGAEQKQIESWVKTHAFGINPQDPDPGRVTLRRLNRAEYRNAVRDLLGVDFDVQQSLPPDDVGYGFDNIGDVLNLSPTRLEKFIEAAIAVVDLGVPKDTIAISSQSFLDRDFVSEDGRDANHMSFYQARKVSKTVHARTAGEYRINIHCKIDGEASPRDPQECRVHFKSDDQEFLTKQYEWNDNLWLEYESVLNWEAGDHEITITTEPIHPELKPLRTKMEFRLITVRVDGPLDRSLWVHPPGYERLYTRDAPPIDPLERRAYATKILEKFASQAFRRPVSQHTLAHLVDLAAKAYSQENTPFETGIAQAIIAILASPRFLFHLEEPLPIAAGETFPRIDEYSLASRLSFALWCSIPDEELTRLAAAGELRNNIDAQVRRMLADPKSRAFVENFSQQWLQTRAILDIPINSAEIMALESNGEAPTDTAASGDGGRGRRGRPSFTGKELTREVRSAMMQEVEAYFGYVVRENRSVLELLDSNYTFVNAALGPVYGKADVSGMEMRKIDLPIDDPRGGVLTMGSVLTVTSNPTRTSPVKRGKWILENILGAPTAPPPPNVPALEDSIEKTGGRQPTQREVLAVHRENALCASCHARMDSLGLALENFNGFGRFRTTEHQQPIDPAGELITGETFAGVGDLKETLVKNHKMEFYRTLAGKLLTYVLGRGIEYYDMATIDEVAERLDRDGGRFSALLMGVLESAPMQKTRVAAAAAKPASEGEPES